MSLIMFLTMFLRVLALGGVEQIDPADLAPEVYEHNASVQIAVQWDGPCAMQWSTDTCWIIVTDGDDGLVLHYNYGDVVLVSGGV